MRHIVGKVSGPERGKTPRESVFRDEKGPLLTVELVDDGFYFPHLLVFPFDKDETLAARGLPPEVLHPRDFRVLHPLLEKLAINVLAKEGRGYYDPEFRELCRELRIVLTAFTPEFPAQTQNCGEEIVAAMNRWFCRHLRADPAYYSFAKGVVNTLRGSAQEETVMSKAPDSRDEWSPEGWELVAQIRTILERHGFLETILESPSPEGGNGDEASA